MCALDGRWRVDTQASMSLLSRIWRGEDEGTEDPRTLNITSPDEVGLNPTSTCFIREIDLFISTQSAVD